MDCGFGTGRFNKAGPRFALLIETFLAFPVALLLVLISATIAYATAPPSINPGSGTYFPGPSVTISGTSGASIFYTLDGSVPRPGSSSIYSSPLTINATTTVKAIAVQGGVNSSVVTAEITVDPSLSVSTTAPAAPIISVASGSLPGPTQVAIATPPDCLCYYGINNPPQPSLGYATLYTGPINIYYSATLNAIAIKNGVSSSVSTTTYTLDSTQWPQPVYGDPTQLKVNVQSPTN